MTDEENHDLRRILFYTHPCVGKYGDDGEMQCNSCGIDFKRMTPAEIAERLHLGVYV